MDRVRVDVSRGWSPLLFVVFLFAYDARTILLREIVVFLLRKMSTILKKATIFFWPVHGDLRPPIRNIGKGRLTAFSHQKPQILDFSPREVQVHGLWGTHFPCFIVISSLNNRGQHWLAKRVLADGDFVEVQTSRLQRVQRTAPPTRRAGARQYALVFQPRPPGCGCV